MPYFDLHVYPLLKITRLNSNDLISSSNMSFLSDIYFTIFQTWSSWKWKKFSVFGKKHSIRFLSIVSWLWNMIVNPSYEYGFLWKKSEKCFFSIVLLFCLMPKEKRKSFIFSKKSCEGEASLIWRNFSINS